MLRPAPGLLLLAALYTPSVGESAPPAPRLPEYVQGEVILKFKPGVSEQNRAKVYAELGGDRIKPLGRINAELRRVHSMSVETAVRRLRSRPDISYAEPNYVLHISETPNDSRFPELYGLNNTGQTGGTVDADIDATQAWDVFTGSSNVLIGVIDTGVDYMHPDLAANIWTNPGEISDNNVDDDQNGYIDDVHGYDFVNEDGDPMDDNGHGSHCSGTIGAVGNNGIGVAGVNWNVKILACKFLSASGSGNAADAIEALNYATTMGVRLTSNSWAGGGFSQALLEAINDAGAAGVLFVAAAGNAAANTDLSPSYPSAYPSVNIVSVAATDHSDNLAFFSNYGVTTVDLAAPGVNILSTTPGNTYSVFSGTSMATPHVAGVLGLIFGRFPNMGPLDAKGLLLNAVDPKPGLAGKCVTGGRLNAFFPIAEPDSIAPGAVTDLDVSATASNGVSLKWTAPGDDGNTGRASGYVVKMSLAPIDSANFEAATTVPNPPDPGSFGTIDTLEVNGLTFNTTYYFAIEARDEFGNEGLLSNTASGTTLGIPHIAVTPDSLSDTLITGATSIHELNLSNVGEGTLDFTIAPPNLLTQVTQGQPFITHGKGEFDPRVGSPVTQGLGGPDGFGYRWVDSDEPEGPTFFWNEISATGTPAISAGDDVNAGPFPIGFDFPFYGSSYDSFRVCSNGWLSLASTENAWDNQPLPHPGAPHLLIAPFWDDLVVGPGATVFYRTDGNDLTIEWSQVSHYNGGGPYTFQAVIHADGSIHYFYQSMAPPLQSATIGIQNETGQDGLTIAFNVPYLHDSMALRIQAMPQWITVSPSSGRVVASGAMPLRVDLNSEGLLGGTYHMKLGIQSNDPAQPVRDIPVSLTVLGAPDIDLPDTAYDFGSVFENASPNAQIKVANPGTDTLHVNEVALVGDGYMVSPTTLSVPPHGFRYLTVSFHPTTLGTYPGTLTLTSDDPDEASRWVTLTGEGVPPPAFSVTPSLLASQLVAGQLESHMVQLRNSGGAPLTFNVAANLEIEHVIYHDDELQKGKEDPGPGVMGQGGPDAFGYTWRDSDDPFGPEFNWIDLGNTGTPIANLTADDQNSGPIDLGFTFPFYGNDFTSVRVCTNGWLSFTSSGTSFSNAALPTGGMQRPNNLIAPFWDDLTFRGFARARYLADGTKFIVQYTGVDKVAPSGANLTFQVILYPNGTIMFQYLTMNGVLNSATMGLQNANRDVGLTVAHNVNYIHDNMAIRIQTPASWLSASPASGTIPAGGEQTLNVIFNASDLLAGAYAGGLDITTNDPLAPLVHLPASLQVTGAPKIQLSMAAIDFGTVYVGYPKLVEYNIMNAGTDDLTITAVTCAHSELLPDSSDVTLPLTLAPLTGAVFRIRFSPMDAGPETADLIIESSDPEHPTFPVALSGAGFLPPEVGVFPDSLTASLLTNKIGNVPLILENHGQSGAVFQIEAVTSFGTEAMPADPEGLAIGKDDADPRAGIQGRGGPDVFGYRWADSKASNGPPYNWIDVSATGASLFSTRTDDGNSGPVPLGFQFPFYGITYDQIHICSNGWLSFTNSTADFSNDPLPSPNAPENLVAAFWDDLVVDPAAGGQVYVQTGPDRCVIQWDNVMKYSEQAGPRFTFEAILFRNGSIVTQYKGLGTTRNRLTIGIQDASRSTGLTVVYNHDYVEPSLAIRFSTGPDWLSASPSAGTAPVGGSAPIQVVMNATGLFGGAYRGTLRIQSNDPTNGILDVPATLNVTPAPDLATQNQLGFGNVLMGHPKELSLITTNTGSLTLHVTSIASADTEYTASPSAFDLAPYESRAVSVVFSPSGEGPKSSSLTVQSDDPDSSIKTVALTGDGLSAPSTTGIVGPKPLNFRLRQNIPNPFQGATRILFDVPEAGHVSLEVFDLSGRGVRVVTDTWYPAGSHEVTWKAEDKRGHPVARGIYFLRMRAGTFTDSRRLQVDR